MRNILLSLFLMAAFALLGADRGPYFHFDFSKCRDGVKSVTDLTGRVTMLSETDTFVFQENALRLAEGVKIYIPDDKLPRLTEKFTFNVWINKCFFGYRSPVLFKGDHPYPVQLLVTMFELYPELCCKLTPAQRGWEGIFVPGGTFGVTRINYDKSVKLHRTGGAPTRPGYWHMLTVVFDRGSSAIYVDGKLYVSRTAEKPFSLPDSKCPLKIGWETVKNSGRLSYASANMLINDFRLYTRPLSPEDVAEIYKSERAGYPDKSYFAPGAVLYPDCNEYLLRLLPGLDPDFKQTLPMTAEYEKRLKNMKPASSAKGASDSRLAEERGGMRLKINGREHFPMMIISGFFGQNVTRGKGAMEIIRDYAATGNGIFGVGTFDARSFWKGDRKYDFSKVDTYLREALQNNPEGKMLVRFHISPLGWFLSTHKNELEYYMSGYKSGGNKAPYYLAGPFGSDLWLGTSSHAVFSLVRHIETQDYGNSVFGYLLSCGDAGEWYWPASFTGGTPGFSPATEKTFRNFLKARYNDDSALQKAWHDSKVTLDTATVPTPELRFAAEHYIFRDFNGPARQVFDFREYMDERTFNELKTHTARLKEACDGRKLVIIYHGYSLLYAGLQYTAHLGGLGIFHRVLNLPTVDGVGTPLDYQERRGGQTGGNINAFNGSAALHKKLIWHENDLRTHLHPKDQFGRTDSEEETVTVMRRGFGQALTRNAGFWFIPIGGNGDFHCSPIQEEFAREAEAGRRTLKDDTSSVAEVAFIFDERTSLYTSVPRKGNTFVHDHAWGTYQNALKMGAPFDMYLAEDFKDVPRNKYKLIVFMNIWQADSSRREMIKRRLEGEKAVIIWNYAPGFVSGRGFDTAAMSDLTPFVFVHNDQQRNGRLTPVSGADKRLLPVNPKVYTVGPWFYTADKDAEVLGKFMGRPALVRKGNVFYSLLPLSREQLTGFCDFAGVHVYSRSGSMFTANKSYIMHHSAKAGDVRIDLPEKCKVTEIFSGRTFEPGRSFVDRSVPAQSTRIFRLERQ